MAPTLEDAIILAARAHKGQKDKAGSPYILHPMRVMLQMSAEAERITAVLHDVVEDTACTFEDLRDMGFPEVVLEALDRLTSRPGEPYEAFIARLAENPIAKKVKLADLADNMDIKRIQSLTPKDMDRLEKYHRAWRVLAQR